MKIGPLTSYVWGFIASALTFVLISTSLETVSQDAPQVNMAIAAILSVGLFFGGLKQVTVVHEAVLTFLGARVPIILTEGWVWTLPWFTGLIEVNTQEKSLIIGDDEKLKVFAIDPDTKRSVEMMVKIVVRYQINDVCKLLQIELETVEKNIVEYSKSALREHAGKTDYLQLMTAKDDVGSEIEQTFIAEVEEVSSSWGIEILGLSLAKVVPADEKFRRAMERKAFEGEDGEGYLTEIKRNVEQIKYYAQQMREMEESGLPVKDAAEMILTMQDKSTMSFVKGFQGTGVMPTFPVDTNKKKKSTTTEGEETK